MKVMQNGKEVKGAKVSYYQSGAPSHVEVEGVNYDPASYQFEDDEPKKKTRTLDKSNVKTKDDGGLMTTQNLTQKNK